MFLTDEPNSIEDFLKAVKFIAPKGMNLKYFIVPTERNTPNLATTAKDNGFLNQDNFKSNVDNVPGVTDTIIYRKADTSEKQSVSHPSIDVTTIPNDFPITKATLDDTVTTDFSDKQPIKTDIIISGGEVMPPNAGVKVLESTERFHDVMLNEDMGIFPKFTVFHFVKERVE